MSLFQKTHLNQSPIVSSLMFYNLKMTAISKLKGVIVVKFSKNK